MKNSTDAFERLVKGSLDQFEVPYNSAEWAELEKSLEGPRNVSWWMSPGMLAALVAGTLVVGGSAFMLTRNVGGGDSAKSTTTEGRTTDEAPSGPSTNEPGMSGSLTNADAQTASGTTSTSGVAATTGALEAAAPSLPNTGTSTSDGRNGLGVSNTASLSNTGGQRVATATFGSGPADDRTKKPGTNKVGTASATTPPTGSSPGGKSNTEMTFKASVSKACPGEEVDFRVENMPTDGIYLWNFGDGSFSNKANPEHTFTKPGNYQVMLSMSAAGVGTIHNKPSSDIITIHEAPSAEFNALKQDFEGHIPSVHFENRSNGGKQYHWEFGDGSTSDVAHPDHIYKKEGVYPVKLTVTGEKGCLDIHEREVRIDCDYNLDAPASFAPAQAQTFMPEALRTLGVKFHLMVYTQDGQLVYETSDASKPWTGRANNRGEVLPFGDFVWVVDVRESLHLAETYTGKVSMKP